MLWYAAISVLALARADPLLFKPGSGYHLCPDLMEVCSDAMECCHQADNTYKCCAKTDKAEDVATPANVICPDGTTCPAGSTCCSQGHGRYGCCPYSHGVCCPDGLHCCPYATLCYPTSDKCSKSVKPEDWFLSQILTAPTKDERPEKGQLHESDVFLAVARSSENSDALAIKDRNVKVEVPANVICPDGSTCPDDHTCCNQGRGHFGCCPMGHAVCCPDGRHCCPYGTRCNPTSDKCLHSDGTHADAFIQLLVMTTQAKSYEIKATEEEHKSPSNSICPDGSTCPDDHTCCNQGGGHFGCCPMGHAVCCPDGSHCCRYGTLCNPTSDKCYHSDGTTADAFIQLLVMTTQAETDDIKATKEEPKSPSNTICPDGSTCPDDHTCCNQGGGHFGCCPMGHAVCCPDGRHCCPYGTLCNSTSDKCNHSDENQQAAINFVIMLKSNRKL